MTDNPADNPYEYIISRLYDIHVESIKMGGSLPMGLVEERQQLTNWWYQLEKKRYEEFIKTKTKS